MKTTMNGKAMTAILMLLFINTGCGGTSQLPPTSSPAPQAVVDQAPSTSKKLGYGFEPGLVPGKDFAAGQLIVGFKEGTNTQNIIQAASALGGQVVGEIQGSSILLQFASETAVKTAASSLLARPDVLFVERNGLMRIPTQPKLPPFKKR